MRKIWLGIFYVVIVAIFFSCTRSEYQRVVEKELARNVRYDSLFLGIGFNMPKKEFYSHCWELNKQQIIRQGPGNLSVQYELDSTQMRSRTYMWFYPEFKDNKINKMPIDFSYLSWAPWNEQLSSDSLLLDVKNLMEKWYGGKFMEVKNAEEKGGQSVWVKVDGNRRIRLYMKSVSVVHADIADLTNLTVKQVEDSSGN
jgi:hypothetical protein